MQDIIDALRKFRDDRNWAEFHTPKDLAISVSVEAGELLELFQWGQDGHQPHTLDKDRVADEAADVLLYVLMLFDRMGLDAEAEARKKMERNALRFPVEAAFGGPKNKT